MLRATVVQLRYIPPPIVSYTYTNTIAGKIFNNRMVIEELDMDRGTADMECDCRSSNYYCSPILLARTERKLFLFNPFPFVRAFVDSDHVRLS